MATSSGASPPKPAVTAAWPKPGYEKTCSTSTDPPKTSDKDAHSMVIAGSTRLRKPWRRRICARLWPRDWAKRT